MEHHESRTDPTKQAMACSMKSLGPHFNTAYHHFIHWLSRRRIAISVVAFASLIGFHLLVLKVPPYHPLIPIQVINLVGTGLILLGLGIRSWAAGMLHKSQEITSVGPYSVVRNPLYLGSFMMMIGFCMLMKDWLSLAFVMGPMAVLYYFQIRVEERNLAAWFRDDWSNYVRRTNRILPGTLSKAILAPWSSRQWARNREYQAVVATLLGLVALGLLANWMT